VAGSLSKTYAMTGWRIGFRASSGFRDQCDHQAAEPLDFEPNIDSLRKPPWKPFADLRIRSPRCLPSIVCGVITSSPAGVDSGREDPDAEGCVLCVSEH